MFCDNNFKFYTYCRVGRKEQIEESINEEKKYERTDYRKICRGDPKR